MRAKTVRRCDITPLRPVERLPDGRVRVDAHLTRAGVFRYKNPDGSERHELRPEEEVFRPESMRSFAQVPFTDDHPEDLLTAATATRFAKGATGDTIVRDDDHLRGTIGVYDAATIRKMEAGKLDVSCGYTCDLVETPGVHPLWGRYDAIQTRIVGNHVALVDSGRAGSAAIRMDASWAVHTDADWNEADHPRGEGGKFGEGAGHDPERARAVGRAAVASQVRAEAMGRDAKILSRAALATKGESAAQAHLQAAVAHEAAAKESERGHFAQPHHVRAAEYHRALAAGRSIGRENMRDLNKIANAPDSRHDADAGLSPTDLGTALALLQAHGTVNAMAKPQRRDVSKDDVPGDPDPDDLASRNARNPDRDDDKPDDAPDDDDETPEMDASAPCVYDTMYDDDGNLTDEARSKMRAQSFAVPDSEKLPINDPKHVRAAMSRFGQTDFADPDEKHAAFNRIVTRAKQFGVGTTGFAATHARNLDRKDSKMIDAKTAAKAQKADKRKEQRDEARARADKAEQDLGAAQGKIVSLETDLAAAKAETGKRTDAAETEFTGKVAAKACLVVQAIAICGVRKDSKLADDVKHYSALSELDIKKAVIKHVDKSDVTDPRPAYIDALFDGAVARATADAAAVAAGANALVAARAAVTPALPITGTAAVKHVDADDDSEEAAARRMRSRTASLSRQPGRMTKDSAIAEMQGSK